MTSTSAFAFHGKEWCNERQRAWHFIERLYTQSHGGPLKYAPSQDGPLQCEAVICCLVYSFNFFLFCFCFFEERLSEPSSRVSSSHRGRRLNYQVQSQ